MRCRSREMRFQLRMLEQDSRLGCADKAVSFDGVRRILRRRGEVGIERAQPEKELAKTDGQCELLRAKLPLGLDKSAIVGRAHMLGIDDSVRQYACQLTGLSPLLLYVVDLPQRHPVDCD